MIIIEHLNLFLGVVSLQGRDERRDGGKGRSGQGTKTIKGKSNTTTLMDGNSVQESNWQRGAKNELVYLDV